MIEPFEMRGGAEFDATERYRYRLWREWDSAKPRVVFVMLNPSEADAVRNDATIRRCIGFARRWDCGSLEAVNLFAWRTPRPKELRLAEDPVGPENDLRLKESLARADRIVAAWGNWGSLMGRNRAVLPLLFQFGAPLCFGVTRSGHPRHPLRLSAETPPAPLSQVILNE